MLEFLKRPYHNNSVVVAAVGYHESNSDIPGSYIEVLGKLQAKVAKLILLTTPTR